MPGGFKNAQIIAELERQFEVLRSMRGTLERHAACLDETVERLRRIDDQVSKLATPDGDTGNETSGARPKKPAPPK